MQKCSKIEPVVVIHLPQKAPNGHRNKITSQHGDSKPLALNPKPKVLLHNLKQATLNP